MDKSIPDSMRALQLDRPNGTLTLREIPVPRPKTGQVLVRMAAAPVNPSDLSTLAGGRYGDERSYPFTPGIEGSGTVVAAGGGLLPRFLLGRRVACSVQPLGDGTWAEYMVTSGKQCVPLKKSVSLEQGAMLLVNPLTALAVFEIAMQGRHRAIISTAAASALGGMLLDLGKRLQIPILHIVRRPEQMKIVRNRGGEFILDSSESDFEAQLQTKAHDLQATLILDAVSGEMTRQLARAAPHGSTILLYGNLSGQAARIDPRDAVRKDLRLQGWYLANWIQQKNVLKVLRLALQAQQLVAGMAQVPVYQRLPLSAAAEGIERYAQNMSAGKILLVADPQAVPLDG